MYHFGIVDFSCNVGTTFGLQGDEASILWEGLRYIVKGDISSLFDMEIAIFGLAYLESM